MLQVFPAGDAPSTAQMDQWQQQVTQPPPTHALVAAATAPVTAAVSAVAASSSPSPLQGDLAAGHGSDVDVQPTPAAPLTAQVSCWLWSMAAAYLSTLGNGLEGWGSMRLAGRLVKHAGRALLMALAAATR